MKESIRTFNRQTQEYTRETVKQSSEVILHVARLIKQGKLGDAIRCLKERQQVAAMQVSDQAYQQEIMLHIAILHYRMNNLQECESELKKLAKVDNMQSGMMCRLIITRTILCIRQQKYDKATKLTEGFINQLRKMPPASKIQFVRESCLKLIGIQSHEDIQFLKLKHQIPKQHILLAIFKMLAEKYEQSKYHVVKALKIWREQNNKTESLLCLNFIVELNDKMNKDSEKYVKEIEKLQKSLNFSIDLENFYKKLQWLRQNISNIMDSLTEQEKEALASIPPLDTFIQALQYKIKNELRRIQRRLDIIKLQFQASDKLGDKSAKESAQEQLTYLEKARNQLHNFLKQIPEDRNAVYVLWRQKSAQQAYHELSRNTKGLMHLFRKFLLLLAFRTLKAEVSQIKEPSD